MSKLLKLLSGVGLCILGIIGLILPIMPGWVFLIPGLILLSDFFPPLKRLLGWAKKRIEEETSRMRGRTSRKPDDAQPK